MEIESMLSVLLVLALNQSIVFSLLFMGAYMSGNYEIVLNINHYGEAMWELTFVVATFLFSMAYLVVIALKFLGYKNE